MINNQEVIYYGKDTNGGLVTGTCERKKLSFNKRRGSFKIRGKNVFVRKEQITVINQESAKKSNLF